MAGIQETLRGDMRDWLKKEGVGRDDSRGED